MSDSCHFCDETEALERHHIVPRRFGGSDADGNLVTVCPTCHRKLERLYNKRFYDALGVEKADSGENQPCSWSECTSEDTKEYTGTERLYACPEHAQCGAPHIHQFGTSRCQNPPVRVVDRPDGSLSLVCAEHSVCAHNGCGNRDVVWMEDEMPYGRYCEPHARRADE